MKNKPVQDRQVASRIVYAVVDSDGKIDANRIYRHTMIDHAIEVAKALTAETGSMYMTIPIILK